METDTRKEFYLALGIGVILILALAVLRMPRPQFAMNIEMNSQPTSTDVEVTATGGAVQVTTNPLKAIGPSFPSISASPIASGSVRFISPPAGDLWPMESQNVISWNHASGVTGQLYLVDAKTKKMVGVILNQVGPNQSYYTWDTENLFLSRTSPTKFTVSTGTYMIGFSFDGNHLPTIFSSAFTIVSPKAK